MPEGLDFESQCCSSSYVPLNFVMLFRAEITPRKIRTLF